MKNPFSRNNNTPEEPQAQKDAKVVEIVDTQLMRWFLYDSGLPGIDQIEGCLGLVPTSEDGLSIEKAESDKRIRDISGFETLASDYATMAAQVWATYSMHQAGHHIGESEEADRIAAQQMMVMSAVAYTTLVGFLSAYRNLGIVAIGDGEQR